MAWDYQRIPPADSQSWVELSRPTYEFLRHPRTWEEIRLEAIRQRTTQDFMRNVLAWLEEKDLASAWEENGVMWWQQVTNSKYPNK